MSEPSLTSSLYCARILTMTTAGEGELVLVLNEGLRGSGWLRGIMALSLLPALWFICDVYLIGRRLTELEQRHWKLMVYLLGDKMYLDSWVLIIYSRLILIENNAQCKETNVYMHSQKCKARGLRAYRPLSRMNLFPNISKSVSISAWRYIVHTQVWSFNQVTKHLCVLYVSWMKIQNTNK